MTNQSNIATIELIDHTSTKPGPTYTFPNGRSFTTTLFFHTVIIDGRKHSVQHASRSRIGQVITNAICSGRDVEYANPFPHKHTTAKIVRPTVEA